MRRALSRRCASLRRMRRPARPALLLALAALVLPLAAACAVDSATPGSSATARPASTKGTPAVLPACAPPYPTGAPTADSVLCADPAHMQAGRVIRIVDGDTLHVDLAGHDETVRLYGINATEVGQPCSAEATARLHALAGAQVRLLPDARDRDRYGRLLRYVYTPDGRSIDAEIVAEGLAHAWTSDGALRSAIIALEARAQTSHVGCLWAQ
jgi:micrococcal nuclease